MKKDAAIAMIGAGAVGCYYGGRLAEAGRDVHFLLRRDYEAVRREGLRVKSCRGDFRLGPGEIKVYDDSHKMPAADLVMVTLKSTANREFARLISPVVRDGTILLTLQNGLGNEEALAAIFGAERIVGGIAFTCINRSGAGRIEHTAQGLIRIGEFARGAGDARARQLAAMFNAANVECEAIADLRQARWEKLLWNVPFNGLSAVMDMTTDRLLASREGEEIVRRIMEDVIAAARSAGITISLGLIEENIAKTRGMGAYLTSSHIDRREGRPLEVEAIFGNPVKQALAAQVRVPWMEALLTMVRALDASQRVSELASQRVSECGGML